MPTISNTRRQLAPVALTAGLLLVGGLLTGCTPSKLELVAAEKNSGVVESEPGPRAKSTPTPKVTVREMTTTEPLPFAQVQSDDANRDVGDNAITMAGTAGVQTNTWRVTTTGGVETDRTLVRQEVTVAPVDEVTSIGTRLPPPPPPPAAAPSGCDPNYGGQCVPVSSDVDCGGGSGNGPAYVNGVVTVIGSDVYDLDRDGDGVGCD